MKLEAKQREQFREKQKEIFSSKQVEKDLFQSQKACEQLDKAKVGNIRQTKNQIILNHPLVWDFRNLPPPPPLPTIPQRENLLDPSCDMIYIAVIEFHISGPKLQ